MSPKVRVLSDVERILLINHDAFIVRLSRTGGVTHAAIESRTLNNGKYFTKLLFEKRKATKTAAIQLATDLAKITGTKHIYIVHETVAPDTSSES